MKRISRCGADCLLCEYCGKTCKGCNQCGGIVFHTGGKPCAIYKCVTDNSLADCHACDKKVCGIWRAARDPSYTDEQFEKSVQNRIRVLEAKNNGNYIVTPRLIIMPLKVTDANDAFKWCGDPAVTEFMNYTTYTSVNGVAEWIAQSGYNCFGIFIRENLQLIGSGDVHKNENGDYELGYNFAKDYWGLGYATEASKAMLSHRVAQGVTDFVCEHAQDNIRSGNVIRKCGFVNPVESSYTSFDGTRTFKSFKYTLHINKHEMSVDGQWFDKIAEGRKTVELRLNDGRRRCIQPNDYIVLNNTDETADLRKCVVQVAALYTFADFAQLYKHLDMSKCGYSVDEYPNPDDMLAYYPYQRQAEHGVVGIEFKLLCTL